MATTDGIRVRHLGSRATSASNRPSPTWLWSAVCALLLPLLGSCGVLGSSSPGFEEEELVDVILVTADGGSWRVTTAPDLTPAEFADQAEGNEKLASPGQMRLLLDALADEGFFDDAEDIAPVSGGSLTVRFTAESRDEDEPSLYTVTRPLTDFDRARKYRRYIDTFHNEGFNKITQLRPSTDPRSVLRNFQRGNR